MDFIREVHGNILIEVVNLTRATLKEADEFKQILIEDISAGWRKVIVDLSECEFIDSTFLGTLGGISQEAHNTRGRSQAYWFSAGGTYYV
jgi:anti-anti-sigma regulatory factor